MSADEHIDNKPDTTEAFQKPKAGQRFTEMFSFWVHVVHADEKTVIVEEYSPPCEIPKDRKLRTFASHDEFRKTYSYGSIPGYWVRYIDDEAPVDHVDLADLVEMVHSPNVK